MKILVTGGMGFIGINLALKLLIQKHNVILADNFKTSEKSKLNILKEYKNWQFVETDICEDLPGTITKNKFDQIYHLACPTGVPNLLKMAEEMLLTCSIGTRNILEKAKKDNARFLYTSSSEVYGDPLVFPQSENYTGNVDPLGFRSAYEEGKRFAESLTVAYFRKYKMPVFMVRVFNTYGPGMSFSDSRVVPNMLLSALRNKPITVHGKGEQTRTFCYVDDLVEGLILVMNKGRAGEIYNLGSDEEISIDKLSRLVLKITGSKSKIHYSKRPEHDHKRRLPDITKIRKLGWRQTITLEKGIALTYSSIN